MAAGNGGSWVGTKDNSQESLLPSPIGSGVRWVIRIHWNILVKYSTAEPCVLAPKWRILGQHLRTQQYPQASFYFPVLKDLKLLGWPGIHLVERS